MKTKTVPREALEDALDGLCEMIGYVPEYFIWKWSLQDYIDRAERVLRDGDID
jgi:hypothetical protein